MPENSSEQSPQYSIALGKTIGERVLGIIPGLSSDQISQLPITDHFLVTRVREFADGSQALHLASRQVEVVADCIDKGFIDQAGAIAKHLKIDEIDETVRRISAGSLFEIPKRFN